MLLLAHALAMVVAEVQHRVVGVKAAVNIALVTIESGVALTLFRALHVGQIPTRAPGRRCISRSW